ncbi:MAG TPA: C15orf41 family protein [Methanomassiliicoccales archaeon]|nr:C15orf41 family protein [Methanomassiliicoccales archaeon]
MKFEDFKHLYNCLNQPSDIEVLSEKLGLDEELLRVIYTQRTVRETTKAFYRVEKYSAHMLSDWNRGMSIMNISKKAEFSPILTGLMLFKEMGKSKKQFWAYVREPDTIPSARLKKDIIEIAEADHIYSPWANEVQVKRGQWGEGQLQGWLKENEITFRTEKDIRGEFTKTPDCLFHQPVQVNGWKVNWIESKATFGDRIEVNRNVKKQLEPYLEMFGQGVVVYWFGYVDDIKVPEGIHIIDGSLTGHKCEYVTGAKACHYE